MARANISKANISAREVWLREKWVLRFNRALLWIVGVRVIEKG
jgi:hypothetical protein